MVELNCEKDIENIHTWAIDYMEGCDEPEWTMFNKIACAIEDYWDAIYVKGHMEFAIKDTVKQMQNALKMLENS